MDRTGALLSREGTDGHAVALSQLREYLGLSQADPSYFDERLGERMPTAFRLAVAACGLWLWGLVAMIAVTPSGSMDPAKRRSTQSSWRRSERAPSLAAKQHCLDSSFQYPPFHTATLSDGCPHETCVFAHEEAVQFLAGGFSDRVAQSRD
jgi:hypothetical protein